MQSRGRFYLLDLIHYYQQRVQYAIVEMIPYGFVYIFSTPKNKTMKNGTVTKRNRFYSPTTGHHITRALMSNTASP